MHSHTRCCKTAGEACRLTGKTAAETPLTPTPTFGGKGGRFPSLLPLPTLRSAGWEGEVVTDSTLGTL